MDIQIVLKKLLKQHGLDRFGVIQEIAASTNLHRHTVGKLYHNQQKSPSLESLGAICGWLHENGVPARDLPGALFSAGADDLAAALAAHGRCTIYLGEQRQRTTNLTWVARRDATAETEIVRYLSTPGVCGIIHPQLQTEYVPFCMEMGPANPRDFQQDQTGAARMFRYMTANLPRSSAIMIGSQRVNYLTELFVADLFGCAPFFSDDSIHVPFWFLFPNPLRDIESCFGGVSSPPKPRGVSGKGAYYLDENDMWVHCPWVDAKEDAGIVIVSHEPGVGGLQLALLGLSGRATEALGRYVARDTKPFWPPYAKDAAGRHVGVYICRFGFAAPRRGQISDQAFPKDIKIIPIKEKVLRKYLRGRATRGVATQHKPRRRGLP